MYLPYLMLGYAAATLLVLIGCRVAARVVPGLAGVQRLSWGLVAALAGMLFLALGAHMPLWVTLVLASMAVFSYSALLYAALIECIGVRSRILLWGVALFVVGIAGNLYFAYVEPSVTARRIIAIVLPAVCAVVSARLIFRTRPILMQHHCRNAGCSYIVGTLGWLQVAIVITATVRCVLSILYPSSDVMHVDLIQVAGSYLTLLLNLAAGAGLIWFAFWLQREELHTRANTDGLTGLLNRRAFDEILVRELNRARAGGRSLLVMMADIDFFKRVNDTLGHPAGDEVLRRLADTLHQTLRPADVLCRFGGEEFAILLRETQLRMAPEAAERLRAAVAALTDLPNGIRITISIGLAGSLPGETLNELMARCDQALYHSKREGRNRVSIAAPAKDGEPSVIPPAPRLVSSSKSQRSA
jgi:diguanylate cyclase (GGDEF)-like protein